MNGTWVCPYCGAGFPDQTRWSRGKPTFSGVTSMATCAVCKGHHRICDRCCKTEEVFWDKPGGDMKVRRCEKTLKVLNAIEEAGRPPTLGTPTWTGIDVAKGKDWTGRGKA